MKKEIYNFAVGAILTRKEMEDFLLEINNCEFCNNGAFNLNLKEFSYDELQNIGIGIVDVEYNDNINIEDKIHEMSYCEFCHNETDYLSIVKQKYFDEG